MTGRLGLQVSVTGFLIVRLGNLTYFSGHLYGLVCHLKTRPKPIIPPELSLVK